MKLTYDPKHNIAYIQLRDKPQTVDSIKISEELIIDIGQDGTVYGIELLNAKDQLENQKSLQLFFVNEATGEEQQFKIAV